MLVRNWLPFTQSSFQTSLQCTLHYRATWNRSSMKMANTSAQKRWKGFTNPYCTSNSSSVFWWKLPKVISADASLVGVVLPLTHRYPQGLYKFTDALKYFHRRKNAIGILRENHWVLWRWVVFRKLFLVYLLGTHFWQKPLDHFQDIKGIMRWSRNNILFRKKFKNLW